MANPALRKLALKGGSEPIAVDVNVEAGEWPDELHLMKLCRRAIDAAQSELRLPTPETGCEVSVTFTGDKEIQALNAEWRAKDKPTNVLSFPAFATIKRGPLPPLLGDIILADWTVRMEAQREGKPLDHHIAHLVVHGFLHLVGYDHETDEEGDEMEALESEILARLAIPDPYA